MRTPSFQRHRVAAFWKLYFILCLRHNSQGHCLLLSHIRYDEISGAPPPPTSAAAGFCATCVSETLK